MDGSKGKLDYARPGSRSGRPVERMGEWVTPLIPFLIAAAVLDFAALFFLPQWIDPEFRNLTSGTLFICGIALLAVLAGLVGYRRALRERTIEAKGVPDESYRVHFDDTSIHIQGPPGSPSQMRWVDLERVTVETTADGPFAEDIFFVLYGKGTICVIPNSAEGRSQLVTRLLQIPGFDHRSFMDAMGCTENRTFVCWRREKAG